MEANLSRISIGNVYTEIVIFSEALGIMQGISSVVRPWRIPELLHVPVAGLTWNMYGPLKKQYLTSYLRVSIVPLIISAWG